MSYQVNAKMCSTCIFSQRSPITQERFQQLKVDWEEYGVVQACHHSTMQGDDVGCRGYHEAARRGEIANNPVMRIANDMGLSSLRPEQAFGFFEAIKNIEFVEVEE